MPKGMVFHRTKALMQRMRPQYRKLLCNDAVMMIVQQKAIGEGNLTMAFCCTLCGEDWRERLPKPIERIMP